jgi:glycosyltransferase involved in cell wall biosynthesis
MKILAYDDSLDFGGHQTMACQGFETLAADSAFNVVFMSNPRNRRLCDRVARIPNLETLETPCTTRRFQGLRNRLNQAGMRALEKEFRALKPDLVLCIQGDIEQSSQAVLAARRAGIHCLSYIAIPHRMTEMGATLGALRDRTNQYLLNQPDRYIAISESMKRLLIERGVTKPIIVVPNGIPQPQTPNRKPQTDHPVLGLLGRIEFKQKRQDFMVQAFCDYPEAFRDCRLLVGGSGPDEAPLKQLAAQCPRRNDITLLPWKNDVESFYEQIDFLMLPSRYEGMPIVMLEALARGIPVIGSARDGMAELLPPFWLHEPENAKALATTFTDVQRTWMNEIGRLQDKVRTEMTIEAFQAAFHQAVFRS